MMEKQMRNMPYNSFASFAALEIMVSLAIGVYFSSHIVKYSYYLLVLSVLLAAVHSQTILGNWHNKKQTTFNQHIPGRAGIILLLIFLGAQSPQLHIGVPLGLALIFLILALFNLKK